ncbi:MAG: RNA polymerase sigma factor [Patescibacteria group bacterium]|nr:RNA polymerase sigma factor [Patescibacteria group bacterium]
MDYLKKQFEEAYENYANAIYRLCIYKTSNHEQAEDLTQEVFIRYWDYVSEGGKVLNIKAFLYQTARNLIIDYYRKKKTSSLDVLQEQGFDPSADDHNRIVNESEKNIAIQIIEKLDDKYRDVVYLRLVDDMSMEEIAQTLKISTNNATVRFHRGYKQLESYIKNNENR